MTAPADHQSDSQPRHPSAGAFLVGGALAVVAGALLIVFDVLDDSRRVLLPWVVVVLGVVLLGRGVSEWRRTGALGARRAKTAEDVRLEKERERRHLRRQLIRVGVVVLAVATVVVVRLLD